MKTFKVFESMWRIEEEVQSKTEHTIFTKKMLLWYTGPFLYSEIILILRKFWFNLLQKGKFVWKIIDPVHRSFLFKNIRHLKCILIVKTILVAYGSNYWQSDFGSIYWLKQTKIVIKYKLCNFIWFCNV